MEKVKDIELPRPNKEEILNIVKQHIYHLVERKRGKAKTPFGDIEGIDYYCHTCKKWLNITTKLKFQSKPRFIGKKAVWIEGKPDDLNILQKTFNLSNNTLRLLKLKKDDPELFETLRLMWEEDNFLKDLEKLLKKYGFTKEKAIELLESSVNTE